MKNHTQSIVIAAQSALESINSDLAKLDEQRKALIAERRKLNNLVKNYVKESYDSEYVKETEPDHA